VIRFLVLAIPAAMLVIAAVGTGAGALGYGPDLAPLAARAAARTGAPPVTQEVAIALFEATALVALFLLVDGRSRSRLLDGLAAGIAAWLFRGPLLVAAVATLTRLPTAPFWELARVQLLALALAGLAVGALARLTAPHSDP
jgi:hypothetical protein